MRSRLVPALAALAAIACLVAGAVTWRMFSGPPAQPPCPAGTLCGYALPPAPYRLHPLRAELLWAASAALALVAVGTGIRVKAPGSA
jgi:hypothetical protein